MKKNRIMLQAENAVLNTSIEKIVEVTGIDRSILVSLREAFPDRFYARQVIEFSRKKGIGVRELLLALTPEKVCYLPLTIES